MNSKKFFYDVILDQLKFLYNNAHGCCKIANSNFPKYRDDYIGNLQFKINKSNYCEDFNKMLEDNCYTLRFIDDSIITFKYQFQDYKLMDAQIEFIPSYYSDDLFKKQDINDIISKYIRIDFDLKGYKQYSHTLIHMHNNFERDGLRFPVNKIVYPLEFVNFILLNIYNFQWDSLNKKIFTYNLDNKEYLTDNEKKIMCIKVR